MHALRPNRKHIFLSLLLCALALRALVPAGYMPNLAALKKGQIAMQICSVADSSFSAPDSLNDNPARHTNSDKTHSATDCPFNFMSSLAAIPSIPPVVDGIPQLAWMAVVAPRQLIYSSFPAQGPPLGSRAPPLLG
ncbi:DUF2946 domain-containing protein [Herbaspirillum sp. RTI4]|uniref:DUF2946 family protein n=1 Tax=Herbaspirillum sp. RTI4 TaxID=3048640 RepID=UPI002AB49896|nr:DUF2946 family protein [Herbaspirillum sp. RTI4]MDY7579414.1 DUF2946 domain-containing protein [Herbaspirillum sp. RTI4]MEA9980328.1 DUF2946 domain-containing protein [Herbaspirillum sp. RTI4]